MVNWLKEVWKRLTSSKVVWMSLPAAILPFVYILTGADALPVWFESAWAAIWVLLMVFIGANNGGNTDEF